MRMRQNEKAGVSGGVAENTQCNSMTYQVRISTDDDELRQMKDKRTIVKNTEK